MNIIPAEISHKLYRKAHVEKTNNNKKNKQHVFLGTLWRYILKLHPLEIPIVGDFYHRRYLAKNKP